MMPASNNGAGTNVGFPDVCLTPAAPSPVPIPYPNLAQNCMAASFSPNVYTGFMPALNMASTASMTQGDNGGTAHPLFMQAGGQTMGNPIIFVNCVPAKNLLVTTYGNAFNNPIGATLVPSVTTTLYTDGRAVRARGAVLDGESLRALRNAVDCDQAEGGPVVEAEPLSSAVVWLRIRRFVRDVTRRVHNALRGHAPTAVVLDLRGNRGGDVAACLELADELLAPGLVIASKHEPAGARDYCARGPQCYRFAMVVLVDGRTASAAELLAGALQVHRRARLLGAPTAGKATAQQVVARPDGEGFGYESVAEYRLPDGRRVHGAGLSPDLELTPGDDALAAAVRLLSG